KCNFYTKRLSSMMKPKPTTEMTVSSNVHVEKVSFIVKPKNSLNIQNPASLTWEAITLPAPVASTINARLTSDPCIKGMTNPAVVKAATVAEPREIRKMAAIIQANKMGDILLSVKIFATASPTPPSIKTCLN